MDPDPKKFRVLFPVMSRCNAVFEEMDEDGKSLIVFGQIGSIPAHAKVGNVQKIVHEMSVSEVGDMPLERKCPPIVVSHEEECRWYKGTG